MTALAFVVPGALDQLTGGYLFDRHIVEGLRAAGRKVDVIELRRRFSRSRRRSRVTRRARRSRRSPTAPPR